MSIQSSETGVLAINLDATSHKTIKESGNSLVVAEPMESGHADPEKVFTLNMDSSLGTLTITTHSGKFVGLSSTDVFLSDQPQTLKYSIDENDPEHMLIYIIYESVEYWMQMEGTETGNQIIVNNDTEKEPKKRKWKFRKSLGGIEL